MSTTTGGTLQVNSCTVNVGACCQGVSCQLISQAACNQQGGTYKGDNTSCSLCSAMSVESPVVIAGDSCYARPLRATREGAVSSFRG